MYTLHYFAVITWVIGCLFHESVLQETEKLQILFRYFLDILPLLKDNPCLQLHYLLKRDSWELRK